jgi:hypothetical protein
LFLTLVIVHPESWHNDFAVPETGPIEGLPGYLFGLEDCFSFFRNKGKKFAHFSCPDPMRRVGGFLFEWASSCCG